MGITFDKQDKLAALWLKGRVDIALAAELKATLQSALNMRVPMRISLAANAELEVTAMQLLWAAKREANAAGMEFRLSGQLPTAVSASLIEAGLEQFPVPE